jgi:hypothetical protein
MSEEMPVPNSDEGDEYHPGFDFIHVTLRGYGGDTPVGDAFFQALGVSTRDRKRLRVKPGKKLGQPALIPLFSGNP